MSSACNFSSWPPSAASVRRFGATPQLRHRLAKLQGVERVARRVGGRAHRRGDEDGDDGVAAELHRLQQTRERRVAVLRRPPRRQRVDGDAEPVERLDRDALRHRGVRRIERRPLRACEVDEHQRRRRRVAQRRALLVRRRRRRRGRRAASAAAVPEGSDSSASAVVGRRLGEPRGPHRPVVRLAELAPRRSPSWQMVMALRPPTPPRTVGATQSSVQLDMNAPTARRRARSSGGALIDWRRLALHAEATNGEQRSVPPADASRCARSSPGGGGRAPGLI